MCQQQMVYTHQIHYEVMKTGIHCKATVSFIALQWVHVSFHALIVDFVCIEHLLLTHDLSLLINHIGT